jgi:D-lactate dehydrogenase
LAQNCSAVCYFVNDHLDANALQALADLGVKLIPRAAQRLNQADLNAAKETFRSYWADATIIHASI